MSNIYVTPQGFQKKTLAEIKAELETQFSTIFPGVDLDETGPTGQFIGLLAKMSADQWDAQQEIYASRSVLEATGTSLDRIGAEIGIIRIDASPTVVENVRLYGDDGTLIPLGSKIRQSENSINYSSLADATIQKTETAEVLFTFSLDPSAGGVSYDLTIDGEAFNYISSPGDTVTIVRDAFFAYYDGLTNFEITVISEGTDQLRFDSLDKNFAILNTNVDINLLATSTTFSADIDGANAAPSNTLVEIVTPESGWDSVNNPKAGLTGREVESDPEYRLAIQRAFTSGNATDEAIRRNILNEVESVTSVSVFSNRTLVFDGLRPPKSFEAVVTGGTDQDIANTIWASQPSGIQPFGNTGPIEVIDSQGNPKQIFFSRPVPKYAWAIINLTLYNEESFPTDGTTRVANEIVSWSLTEFSLGVDYLIQRLCTPVFRVSGIASFTSQIAVTDLPTDTPSYVTSDIPIDPLSILEFDVSRITVVVV